MNQELPSGRPGVKARQEFQPVSDASPSGTSAVTGGEEPESTGDKQKKKKKSGKRKLGTSRGIETMFRVTYRNNMELSQLADNKANMLISINGIIISVVIALVSPRIGTASWLLVPSIILAVGCTTSLAFAIVASRPRLIRSPVSLEMVLNNETDILFFGNFVNMEQQEYEQAMNALLADRKLLYNNMIRNIFSMGHVLARKYLMLKYSYSAFLGTLSLAVVFFIGIVLGFAAG